MSHRDTGLVAGQVARICALSVLGLLTFLFVLVGGVTGGLGGALVFLGLPLFVLGLGALVVGRARWVFLASRKAGAIACAAGLVVILGGASVSPPPDDVGPSSSPIAADEHEDAGAQAFEPPASPEPSQEPEPQTPSAPTPSAQTPSAQTTTAAADDVIAAAAPESALALLATLEVKGRAPRTGYDRDQFGQAWADTDRNGCDTRNDMLRRDLSSTRLRPGTNGCVVLSGDLDDPFSGTTISFVRGQDTSSAVQIDHVVALSDAWQKGAQQWTPHERRTFANDPLNLLAVDGPLNASKGDGDAATWLPPNRAFRCEYVARQVAVKARYGAWVTVAERAAVARVLTACPDQPPPVSDAPPEPESDAPAPVPPPAPGPAGSCEPSYPGVCIPPLSEVGDLDCGDVEHRRFAVRAPDPHRFDREKDGIGCES